MSKPTEAEIMVALEQLEPVARNRVQAWMMDRWPLGMSAAPAKETVWSRDSLPAEETAADAGRALDIAEAAAGLGAQPTQLRDDGDVRDLSKPPDSAPGWTRGPNGWERWIDCGLEDCQHTPSSVQGVQICTSCHGVRVSEEVVEGDDGNQTVYAVRGIPVTGAMPFEHLMTANEYRTGVFEGPHDQTEGERQARAAAPPEQLREPSHPRWSMRGDVDGRELGSTMQAHDTRIGALGGPEGIFSTAGDEAAGLEEPVLVDDMATMRSQTRLKHLLELLPNWTRLLTYEKWGEHCYRSFHGALRMFDEDRSLASQWVREVDREQLVSLLDTTPLAAVRSAELSLRDDDERAKWRKVVEPRWACDALTLLWRAAHYVVHDDVATKRIELSTALPRPWASTSYVGDASEVDALADKRLRDEASRLLSDLCVASRCREALAAYAVAGQYMRWELLKLLSGTSGGCSHHRLFGTLILAHTRARLLPDSDLDGLWPNWLDQLESARATADITKAVQSILADGSEEVVLAIQPGEVAMVLKEETPVRAGFYSHDWTTGATTTVLLNQHCYPWWLGTVQAALRATLATRVNGSAGTLPVPDVQRGPYR